ncbi:MAG: aminopeptidase P family protein [Deltaproteobacteria bacterium]|nr:aminopeptidase P family protein [Deltaproteobacteria bacterium]
MVHPHVERRARIARELADRVPRGTVALFASGHPRPRNYPANTYPFRADSHFLYLTGASIEGAFLAIDGDQSTLYLPEPDDDHALWHGALPEAAELATATGADVAPLGSLEGALAGRNVVTLPSIDPRAARRQSHLVGREVAPGALDARDVPLADAMIAVRLVHDDWARAELAAAAAITAEGHLAAMSATRPGARESLVRAAFEAVVIAHGGAPAYGSIVTVHGEVLHAPPTAREMRSGDLLLVDAGSESPGGWASDVTRTWPVSGTFSPTQRDIYEVVLASQQAAIDVVAPGVRYRDVHFAAARKLSEGLVALGILRGDPDELVADGVSALFFPHGIGHLLGLDVHDMEDLGDRAGYAPGRTRSSRFGLCYLRLDRDLAAGMAVTIEPGFYRVPALLQGALRERAGDRVDDAVLARYTDVRGIRIEDDVVVTETGCDVLTASIPKSVEAVEHAVRRS